MDLNTTSFQKLDLQGIKTLVQRARLEGWNPGPKDADVFLHTNPDMLLKRPKPDASIGMDGVGTMQPFLH